MDEKTTRKTEWIVAGVLVLMVVLYTAFGPALAPWSSYDAFWVWIGAFLTICILSFLYRDNPLYRFAEHLFIGVSAGYYMALGVWQVMIPNLFGKLTPVWTSSLIPGVMENDPNYWYVIPLLLGMLLLMQLVPKIGWLSRWALSFVVGATAGFYLISYFNSDFMGQIYSTILPVVGMVEGKFSVGETFSNIVIILGVLCGLVYFFFSKEHKGAFGVASKAGIMVLMVTFGASFGYTVMGRISLLIGRMEFLFGDWLHMVVR
ncbi:MAG: hypothetical protein P9M14_05465 [Candidatus Alcyoniella australis]|nr:hypothetical protein [Candidatus Alcyoniella australis]